MRADKVIETIADVTNPQKDGRSRDWNKLPVIPKGSRFVIGDDIMRSSDHKYTWEMVHSPLAIMILANANVVEPKTVKELASIHDCDYGGDEILRCLLKLGRINADDFKAVGEAINADETF